MHGDRVIANIVKRSEGDKREEGAIIRILERENHTIVGTFEGNKGFGFVIPDEQKISYDIFIPKAYINGAEDRQKVVVEITRWPEPRRNQKVRL